MQSQRQPPLWLVCALYWRLTWAHMRELSLRAVAARNSGAVKPLMEQATQDSAGHWPRQTAMQNLEQSGPCVAALEMSPISPVPRQARAQAGSTGGAGDGRRGAF